MDSLIAWVANYLLWVMVAGAAAYWLFGEDRAGKINLAASAVLGLLFTLGLLVLASHVHSDPRPFVVDPSLRPLIAHSRDNGFPSDHSAAAALIATLILLRNRLYGLLFWLAAIAVGVARVAAHVHHVQDIIGGFVIGIVSAVVASLIVGWALTSRQRSARHAVTAPPDAAAGDVPQRPDHSAPA